MKTDFYFATNLTETEHYIVEDMIRNKCKELGYEVKYYRKFKTGHVPCQRECKIMIEPWKARQILDDLDILYGNYHAEENLAFENRPKRFD